MDWKTQNPTFQVLFSIISRDDRPPPLQIRSFTSDSYSAIKERERKKSGWREQSNTEQQSRVWKAAKGVAMQEITRMDSRPHKIVSGTYSGGSGTEPLIIQDWRLQEDDELQHRPRSAGAAPINPLEDPFNGEIQCLAAPASPAMSPKAPGSDSEVCTGAEQEREICRDGVPDPLPASLNDVHMITADGDVAGTFDQQPHIRTRSDAELTAKSPSYPTPADSSAGGCSELCKQPIESRDTRLPGRASLDLDPAPLGADATGLEWLSSTYVADGALAEALPDEPSHTVGVARTIGSHTRRARSERAGSIDCKSTPQSAWTSGQDEQPLYLRNTAQLN